MTSQSLHLIVPGPLDQRTGGYLYDARMAEGLRGLGWSVTVHCLEGRFPDADEQARSSFHGTLAGLPNGTRVVIDGLAMGGLPDQVVAQAARLRILALVHHPLAEETGLEPSQKEWLAATERRALSACVGVLVTSDFTAARVAAFGVPRPQVRVVPPGTEKAPRAVGPGPGQPAQLLSVASVTPRKGHDVLVRALSRLRATSWSCACAGSLTRAPAFARSVQAQAEEAGLADRIRFLGELDAEAVDRLYHTSSLFVLASHYEGYGMALTEALARGLPVVSTTGGAIPSTVPAEAGVLVAPGDDLALADALEGLLSDTLELSDDRSPTGSKRRAQLVEGALRYAARLPDWDQAVKAFAKATSELAPEPSSS